MNEPALPLDDQPLGINLQLFRDLLLDSVGVGLAVADNDGLIVLHNNAFAGWFPDCAGRPLDAVIPSVGKDWRETIETRGRATKAEIRVKPKRREIVLALEIDHGVGDQAGAWLIQCTNISKVKELEYMIESYSKMIERQNRDLRKEKERVEKLLLNIMPQQVYEEWKEFGVTAPQRFDDASVLMLDFVGFTEMSIAHEPNKVISELNDIFTSFDRISEQFGCERLKTMGDAYVAVAGLPDPNPDHARNIAHAALRFMRYLERRNESHDVQWRARVGISSRPVIGSIVGVQKYVYDIFGPGMNLAARLEPLCGPMEILVSTDVYRRLVHEFQFEDRGEHELRGFGKEHVYRLERALVAANDRF